MTTPYTPASTFHSTVRQFDDSTPPVPSLYNAGNQDVADNLAYINTVALPVTKFDVSQYLLHYYNTFFATPPTNPLTSTGSTVTASTTLFSDSNAKADSGLGDIVEIRVDIPYQIGVTTSSQNVFMKVRLSYIDIQTAAATPGTTYYKQFFTDVHQQLVSTCSVRSFFGSITSPIGCRLRLDVSFKASTQGVQNWLQQAFTFDGGTPKYSASVKIWRFRP